MTDHLARLYATALALVVFFVSWAIVAARPWAAEAAANDDPRLAALAEREQRLRRESIRVKRLVERRFAAYRVRLRERQQEIAAANASNAASAAAAAAPAASTAVATPSVGVVSAAPVTSTSTS